MKKAAIPASKTTTPAKGVGAKTAPPAKGVGAKTPKTTYKLTYFDGRGRGEISRLLFAAAGVPFEDVRIKQEDWPKLKEKMPQGTMPVLESDGFVLSQSMAIARHLSRKFDLYGKDLKSMAIVDMILDSVVDMKSAMFAAFLIGTEEQKAVALKAFTEEHLPKFFKIMETIASANKLSGYMVGNTLTVADLAIYDALENVVMQKKDALDKVPALKANRKKVAETKLIKEYLAKRPETAF